MDFLKETYLNLRLFYKDSNPNCNEPIEAFYSRTH